MPDKTPNLSIIIPTFREADNIRLLAERIFQATDAAGISTELIFVDDDSQDGTEKVCDELASRYNIRLIVRKGVRGLATAVVQGLKEAKGRFLLSMDGDLSHPPAAIPEMFKNLSEGADFVLGSRYLDGAHIEQGWGISRWLNSRIATVLARPLVSVSDPMAGFFALPKTELLKGPDLSPLGYKIALELMVKLQPRNIVEIPIEFEDRKFGKSKLCLRVQIEYLKHLRRLYRHAYPLLTELAQFLIVGGLGVGVDVAIYSGLRFLLGVDHIVARGFSFICAATHNWFLNRRYTFLYGQDQRPGRQWVSYLTVMVGGFLLSVGTYAFLTTHVETFAYRHYSALFIGVALSTSMNFVAAKLYVFKKMARALKTKAQKVPQQ